MENNLKLSIKYLLFFSIIIIFLSIITTPFSILAETINILPKYVGSEACKNCHYKEYNSFMKYAKKSKSYDSIERVNKGLTEDEVKGCYYCHTTGYGKPGGFTSIEKTPYLKNAGCEVCHGPGEYHMKTKGLADIKRHLTMKDCEGCHTSERVKAFRYKPLIHGGAH
ncbi:MAG: cytochrome C [Nitrospirae bacterium RBG_13_39_12]|nr:MAG: cytochrome C [Nitrospirae bacterium RBG_13_39_12]